MWRDFPSRTDNAVNCTHAQTQSLKRAHRSTRVHTKIYTSTRYKRMPCPIWLGEAKQASVCFRLLAAINRQSIMHFQDRNIETMAWLVALISASAASNSTYAKFLLVSRKYGISPVPGIITIHPLSVMLLQIPKVPTLPCNEYVVMMCAAAVNCTQRARPLKSRKI